MLVLIVSEWPVDQDLTRFRVSNLPIRKTIRRPVDSRCHVSNRWTLGRPIPLSKATKHAP
jgi:hypothetical protein